MCRAESTGESRARSHSDKKACSTHRSWGCDIVDSSGEKLEKTMQWTSESIQEAGEREEPAQWRELCTA